MEEDALPSARVIQRLLVFVQFEVCSVQVLLYLENILLKRNIYIILYLSDDSIKVKNSRQLFDRGYSYNRPFHLELQSSKTYHILQ